MTQASQDSALIYMRTDDKARYTEAAASQNMSLSAFMRKAADRYIAEIGATDETDAVPMGDER